MTGACELGQRQVESKCESKRAVTGLGVVAGGGVGEEREGREREGEGERECSTLIPLSGGKGGRQGWD